LSVLTRSGDTLNVTAADFADAPRAVARIPLPPNFAPNRREDRHELARRLRSTKLSPPPGSATHRQVTDDDLVPADLLPVARDPDLSERLQAAGLADRLQREVDDLERRVGSRNQSLGRDFDRVLSVLERFGYINLHEWQLNGRGERLSRIFHESDLLVAEVIHHELFDDLSPADTAAVVSTLVYEHRSQDAPPPPWFSSVAVRNRWRTVSAISEDLAAIERSLGLHEHRPPDPTFAAVAYAWVAGEGFAEVVSDEELTGGDFVRTVKQLIDLLRQIALVAPSPATRRSAAAAAEAAYRGVVADSSAPSVVADGSDVGDVFSDAVTVAGAEG
jgi:ATP-dependent RNA helicase HelY